jgi:hypothetical protein
VSCRFFDFFSITAAGFFGSPAEAGAEITPQSAITTGSYGRLVLLAVSTRAIVRNTSTPEIISPNTTCLPSRCGVDFRQMKN